MSKNVMEYILNLDYQDGKVIRETPQFYVVRFIFKDGLYFISKIRKKDLLNKGYSINLKLRQIFDNYNEVCVNENYPTRWYMV